MRSLQKPVWQPSCFSKRKIKMRLKVFLIFVSISISYGDKGCGQRLTQRRGLGTIKRVNRVDDSTANISEVMMK